VKILIADDHGLMRDGLRAILEKEQPIGSEPLVVVGDASNGREALELTHRLRADLVLMDISMPDLNGIDATRRIKSELPHVKVIALSVNSDQRYVLAMFKAGAVGFMLKSSASDELIRAIHAVAAGHKYVSPAIAGVVLENLTEGSADEGPPRKQTPTPFSASKALSPREREVLQLLAEGKSSKEIGQRLNVALPTVESHRRQIMDKLGLRSIAELTKYAIREGLTSLE
jgi:DNA-binding NarL/FixJ family response regulator